MTVLGYLLYVVIIFFIAFVAWTRHISVAGIYLVISAIIFIATVVRWVIACQDGTIYHDRKKVEQIDNSVTKPADFKHCFIYNDCSSKTLFFLELPYLICIAACLLLKIFC